ncbi:MAG: ABC transporter permease [Bacteroidales bacterium]|nr:ABC transporter permease [Bacteroidales bacterium]
MAALKYLLIKEVKQFKANPFLPRLAVVFPLMVMLVMPWIATMDVKDVNLSVVDQDRSSTSEKLIKQIEASHYFHLKTLNITYEEALVEVEKGKSDLIMQIPQGMERDWVNGQPVEIFIAANAVNSTKGSMGSGYLNNIISDFSTELSRQKGEVAAFPVKLSTQFLYNSHLNYRYFMVPALLIVILIALCGFLPTFNIVTEKENGTIEQINVTPVGKGEFIASKLIFYGVLGLFIFTVAFFIGKSVYHIAPYGNIGVIYAGAVLFLLFMAAIGLFISNFSITLQQAVFTMFFFMMTFMLLSGIFTPINSMVTWAQYFTYILPPRYFVNIMRSVCLKGSGFADLWFDFLMLFIFMAIMSVIAVVTYRKQQ